MGYRGFIYSQDYAFMTFMYSGTDTAKPCCMTLCFCMREVRVCLVKVVPLQDFILDFENFHEKTPGSPVMPGFLPIHRSCFESRLDLPLNWPLVRRRDFRETKALQVLCLRLKNTRTHAHLVYVCGFVWRRVPRSMQSVQLIIDRDH